MNTSDRNTFAQNIMGRARQGLSRVEGPSGIVASHNSKTFETRGFGYSAGIVYFVYGILVVETSYEHDH